MSLYLISYYVYEMSSYVFFRYSTEGFGPKDMAKLILEQALIGPAPNTLTLSYLRHCLASGLLSHASLLSALTTLEPRWRRPHCTAALLDLATELVTTLTSKGSDEECLDLCISTQVIFFMALLNETQRREADLRPNAKCPTDQNS